MSILSILFRLFRADNLTDILIQKVLGQVFPLVGQLTTAFQGVLKLVVGTLIDKLHQLLGFFSCLNENGSDHLSVGR